MESKKLSLLPHQYELIKDDQTRVLGLVSGFGGGKTFAVARKAVDLLLKNPGYDGIITEPNYPLLHQILIPELKDALDFFEVEYVFNKAESVFYCNVFGKQTRVICKSLENYDRLIGINAAWVICDEFDTTKADTAYNAFLKLQGRIRTGLVRQFVIVSTPEGYKAMYKIFVSDDKKNRKLIKAKTTDNKHLPKDYIDELFDAYPEKLIEAYINGQFVNLTTGTVYEYFKRTEHDTNQVIQEGEPLHIGQDFNIGGCCSAVCVERGNEMHCVDELQSHDTMQLIQNLKQRYPNNPITIYPDASGYAGKTNASISDNQMLINAGYKLVAPRKNGLVKDRINSVNIMFSKKKLFVNTEKCVNITSALEQQAYDKNGSPEKHPGAATPDDWNDSLGYVVVRHQEQQAQGLVNLKMRVG